MANAHGLLRTNSQFSLWHLGDTWELVMKVQIPLCFTICLDAKGSHLASDWVVRVILTQGIGGSWLLGIQATESRTDMLEKRLSLLGQHFPSRWLTWASRQLS